MPELSAQVDRNQTISEAAYYIAEQRGFTPAQENGDWLEAEKQIGEMLGETNGEYNDEYPKRI